MNIEKIKLNDINPAEYNPRLDLQPEDLEYQALKKSIAKFDDVDPMVWNKRTGNLVGGHQRYKILKAAGRRVATVVVVDKSERDEKLLNLALNKIEGAWDFSKLVYVLESIDPAHLDVTGFRQAEMEAIAEWGIEPPELPGNVDLTGGGREKASIIEFEFADAGTLEEAKLAMGLPLEDDIFSESMIDHQLGMLAGTVNSEGE